MPKSKKKDVDARIEQVGQQRARGVPVADLAAKFDVTDRQIRLDYQEWLKRRKEERGADSLQLEEVFAQYDEVLSAAWRDHELLGAGMTSLDPKTARARSELLRIALSAIDRKVSLLGLSGAGQESSRSLQVIGQVHTPVLDLDACGVSNDANGIGSPEDLSEVQEMEKLIGHDNYQPPEPEVQTDETDDEEVD